jgi:hypothetical protein
LSEKTAAVAPGVAEFSEKTASPATENGFSENPAAVTKYYRRRILRESVGGQEFYRHRFLSY